MKTVFYIFNIESFSLSFVAVWVEWWLHALYQFIIAYAMAEYHLSPEDHEGYRVPCQGAIETFLLSGGGWWLLRAD